MSLGSVPIGADHIGREGMVNAVHVRRDVFVGCSIGPGPKPGGVCRLLATASAEVPLGSQAQAPGACLARSARKRLAAHRQQRSDRRVKSDRRTSVSHTARHGIHGRVLVCRTSCLRDARPRLRTYDVRYVRRTKRSHGRSLRDVKCEGAHGQRITAVCVRHGALWTLTLMDRLEDV